MMMITQAGIMIMMMMIMMVSRRRPRDRAVPVGPRGPAMALGAGSPGA